MSDVSTAHSGSIRFNASAIASAPKAATVTLKARASCAFRDRIAADRRFRKATMRRFRNVTGQAPYRRHWAWLLAAARGRLETRNQPAHPVQYQQGNTMDAQPSTPAAYVATVTL